MANSDINKQTSYLTESTEQVLYFWKQELAGASCQVDLQTDHPRSVASQNRNAMFNFTIPEICANGLEGINSQYETSFFMIFLSAFNILLYRHTNQTDIVVGCPPNDYNISAEGYLTQSTGNILPIRSDLSGNPTFLELVQRVMKVVCRANEHKPLPAEVLEEHAFLPREESQSNQLSEVNFAFRNYADSGVDPQLSPRSSQIRDSQKATIDLELLIEEKNGGVTGALKYNAALFEEKTIRRMALHFKILLDGIVADPNQRIAELPILDEKELHKILFEWNDTEAAYPWGKCLHELFEDQANLTPGAVAVELHQDIIIFFSNANRQLTYSELNKRANQLAHYLQNQGVGPDVLVGIYMKRSLEMAVAVLGILKAGGAYVPIDPAYPKNRVDFMLKDSGISILLTQCQLTNQLPPNQLQLISLDADWNKIATYENENCISRAKPENLAYVIYTSGSTGLPKGTLIMHNGVVNYLCWCIKAYKVEAGNGCPVNSSIGFDATITSFLSPLLTGKKIVLLPEVGEIESLVNVLRSKNKFSLVKITPAHLEILGNLLSPGELEGKVNALVIGGETLTGKNLQFWRKHAPATRLINEYGPTETVVGCCTYEVSEKNIPMGDIPIGRPIANTQLYILNTALQPVPIGVAGELYIGGSGLARGYHNRPELTAERFVKNPFSTKPGDRLYKTGDMARFLSDGNIVFLGRTDHQVKIRGYRIELGEIESTLGQHRDIQQCAVIVREEVPGDKHLVAYLVLTQNPEIKTKDIKVFLRETLPEYMVPSIFVIMEHFPLTLNGKIDRAALPTHVQQQPQMEKTFGPPQNKLEIKLVKIFEQALKINHIGIEDDIFDLGLNSLQAYRLFAQIKKITNIQLPLSILFEAKTIQQIAAYLQRKEVTAAWSSLVPIQPKGSKLPIYCVHGGGGTVLFYRELSQCLGEDQPMYGLQPKGLDGKQTFHSCIKEMAGHYIDEILKVNPEGPYLLAGYCFGGVIAFEMAQQLISRGYKAPLIANFNAVSPNYIHQIPSANNASNNEKEKPQQLKTNTAVRSGLKWKMKKFAALTTKEKIQYLSVKIKHKISVIIWRLKIFCLPIVMAVFAYIYKCCRTLGIRSPELSRRCYFGHTNSRMVSNYKPKPYPGPVIIFRSPHIYADPFLGWGNFIKGEIRTIEIPGDHQTRFQIMKEPFVGFVAKELKKYTDEYIRNYTSTQSTN